MFSAKYLIGVMALGLGVAHAQPYPTKPVRVIVNFAPGGSTDVVMRILAPRMSEMLGQQVVVENRPGGGTILGAEMAARSSSIDEPLTPDNASVRAFSTQGSANLRPVKMDTDAI